MCSVIGVLESHFLGFLDCTIFILFPVICNGLIKWIFKVWSSHQGLDWEQDSSDLESWGPFVLQDIEADSSKLIDIWVVDFGSEKNLWGNHWILVWKEEFTGEQSSLVWSLCWSSNLDKEMSEICLIWLSVDAYNWILGKSLSFFQNSWWNGHCYFLSKLY